MKLFALRFATVSTASLAVIGSIAVGEAEAALVGASPLCTNGNALTEMNPDAITCSGAWAGNDANQQTDVLAQLSSDFASYTGGLVTWVFNGKSDDSLNGPFTSNPGGTTGTLTFDVAQEGLFSIALKASNQFSLYLFDGGAAGISSIDFTTIGTSLNNNQVQPQDLSHASLYRPGGTPIPTPALLPGLIGMGLAAWRKRKSEQAESEA
jgi:hypothetical protein